ncbi:E3 ubiquitin-protein ligase RNF19B-like isoform X2 [Tachypleus tridentatus]|uniref:E3 ubiquitin-protein ligase RNF19B-like isoform X2 n=2 Tax=Tachypleus tridentatus TaxID=6853 RepID=UPI003FD4625C
MASASSTHFPSGIPPGPRKHGFGRFSLGHIFNGASFSHRGAGRHRPVPSETISRSEISIMSGCPLNSKNLTNGKEVIKLPTVDQPFDLECNSVSSACSDVLPGSFKGEKVDRLECPFCLLELPIHCFPKLSSCSHRACYNCLQTYFRIEISESRVNISCPECTEPLHPNDIRMILNDESALAKYENFMIRRVLVTDVDARWCPAPDCGYVVIATGCASCPKLKCDRPGCDTFFCYHCKQEWHPNQTCDAARAERVHNSPHPRSTSVLFSQDSIIQKAIKLCPCCKVLIVKMEDGSCNHMTCSVCGTEFCWLCMNEITDLHYLSPSGCTFWGKKPWSRKKKIVWQLGMLVGAPVGIALIAGIAIPAIIIGIPVWVGRKLHRYHVNKNSGRHKRNLAVTAGVITSVLLSPVLAGIAAGIGVPVLLAYVYGVVPISLCRSGGCGVTTSASGVRFEFDEENDIGVVADGMSVDTAASHRGINQSIGEVSFGMSTSISMGSGSHLERIGLIPESDGESASNTALAGSIASSSLTTTQKLEVQVDISSNKRLSLSSHTESVSANLSLADDASTKALAGSLLGYRDKVDVHIDAESSTEDTSLPHGILKEGEGAASCKACEAVSMRIGDSCLLCSYGEDGNIRGVGGYGYRWKMSGRWQQVGVDRGPLASRIPENRNSEPRKDLRECYVSFIDESPGVGERSGAEKGVKPKSALSSGGSSVVSLPEETEHLCCCKIKKLATDWDDHHSRARKISRSASLGSKNFSKILSSASTELQCARTKSCDFTCEKVNQRKGESSQEVHDNLDDKLFKSFSLKSSGQFVSALCCSEELGSNIERNCIPRPPSAPY